jgi:dTDP-4-dehydrorhamnose 3,5-epimerase
MVVSQTGFNGLLLLQPKVLGDSRGYFMESYNRQTFLNAGIDINFVQDNQSRSSNGVIRGLHFQRPPYAQTKLVRVLSGAVLDIVVDLREKEPTYGSTYTVELSDENKMQLLVPKGFAHGFMVQSESAEVFYKCDEFYHPEADGGIHYTSANVVWPAKFLVSPKDLNLPHLFESKVKF